MSREGVVANRSAGNTNCLDLIGRLSTRVSEPTGGCDPTPKRVSETHS